MVGGKLYTYAAGTTTPLATYTDDSGATPNTNPIILNSRGEASVWLGTAAYKFKLTDATNVEIWTVDNITGSDSFIAALAAANGSSLVGYTQGSAGAVTRTVQSRLRDTVSVMDFGAVGNGATDDTAAFAAAVSACGGKNIYVPSGTYPLTSSVGVQFTTNWLMDANAQISGVGYLTGNQVKFGPYLNTWVGTPANGIFEYLEQYSAFNVRDHGGSIGLFAASETGLNPSGQINIPVATFSYNNNTTNPQGIWGLYTTVLHENNNLSSSIGLEVDIATTNSTSIPIYPDRMFPTGQTNALWVCSGGEATASPNPSGYVKTASVALGIVSNDPNYIANFDKGIVFHNRSLNGSNGVTGTGTAIALAPGHFLNWYNNTNNQIVGTLGCSTQTAANALYVTTDDYGFHVANRNTGQDFLSVGLNATGVNSVIVDSGSTGVAPTISAKSNTDTNVDLRLIGQGTGTVSFGYTIGTPITCTGYITIKDSTGVTRRLMVG